MCTVQDYFLEIANEYQRVLDELSDSWSSQKDLEQTFCLHRNVAITRLKDIYRPTHSAYSTDRSIGLNSIGLLLDRLSILSIKVWRLRCQADANSDAIQRCNAQIFDIVGALSEALPVKNNLNSKITIHQTSVEAMVRTEKGEV